MSAKRGEVVKNPEKLADVICERPLRLLNVHQRLRSEHELQFSFCPGSLYHLQRLSLLHTLDSHRGCVNTVAWNEAGTLLLSGSDDRRLVVTDPFSRSALPKVGLIPLQRPKNFFQPPSIMVQARCGRRGDHSPSQHLFGQVPALHQ